LRSIRAYKRRRGLTKAGQRLSIMMLISRRRRWTWRSGQRQVWSCIPIAAVSSPMRNSIDERLHSGIGYARPVSRAI